MLMVAGIIACKKEVIERFAGFQKPANFPLPVYKLQNNEITKEGFELGRKLFYDPVLSADSSISCGNCHIQTSAFTHHGHTVSHGIHDRLGTRNSPAIMNLAWYKSFMWDGGIGDLDLQPAAPITNPVEMDETMENVLQKLRRSKHYPAMFEQAFGSSEINTTVFLKSLSQFMLMCISSNSKYDSVMRNEAGKTFTSAEQEGYSIFKQNCNACHKEPLFTDNSFRNNGIGTGRFDDKGLYAVTLNINDEYKFKVPSLRNVSFTAPYMHDGRLLTLEAVLDHYSTHVKASPTLDPLLQQNVQPGIVLTAAEKNNLIAFLKTLDDRSFLLNPALSEQ